ncbi:MAG: HPF/RaiA family ribosome-associated protein [Acidobacteria bacterium]|nr:HPF/RaiA family ribosome-associated protein [Acidobacteriota bacterium]
MRIPMQVTFRNLSYSDAVAARVQREATKLGTFYQRILGCRVLVEVPHRHHVVGNPFHIRVDLTLPGGTVVVNQAPSLYASGQRSEMEEHTKSDEVAASHKCLDVALREAFNAARRRLQDYARCQRGDVQVAERPLRGHVSRLFPQKGYGYIKTADAEEIYFHRNSVLEGRFKDLTVGSEVIFAEEQGEQGPQASTVRASGRHPGH